MTKVSELQFQGISENLKYIFTNKGIMQTGDYFKNNGNTKFIDYSFENLPIAVDILKEHKEIYYKLNMISLSEYSSSSRKFLYQLLEIFQPKNHINVIKEWEENYGNKLLLINESSDKLLIETRINESWNAIKDIIMEAWYNPLSWDWKGGVKRAGKWVGDQVKGAVDWTKEQGKQIQQKGLATWAADKAKSVWNSVKDAVSKAYKCLTNNFVECLMEGVRKASFSAVGLGVMTAVTFIPGVGQIADFIVFGSLLIWDIYKALSGKYESGEYKWSWADIIIDAVCILLPALAGGLKPALKGVGSAGEVAAKAAEKGGILAKAVEALKGGVSKIIEVIGKAASWIGEKLGITWLSNFGTKAQSFMSKTVTEMGGKASAEVAGAESKSLMQKATTKLADAKKGVGQFTKDFKFTKPTPVVVKKTGQTIILTGALCAALGVDGWTCQHKVANGEISKEQLEAAAKSLASKENVNKLNQMTDAEIKQAQLF